jgi:hypothetical protein
MNLSSSTTFPMRLNGFLTGYLARFGVRSLDTKYTASGSPARGREAGIEVLASSQGGKWTTLVSQTLRG